MACEVIPELIFRIEKGTFLTPLELDGNFSLIKDSFAELCAIIDVLDTGVGGGITGLDARVTVNEGDIAQNVLDIAQNALDIAQNAADIAGTTGLITANTGNIATNATAIAANITDIAAINVSIGGFAGDIATNAVDIATNVVDISSNAAAIAINATSITNLGSQQSTNTANIGTNLTNIAQNATDIADNATDIAANLAAAAANATAINLIGQFSNANTLALTITDAINALAQNLDLQTAGGVPPGALSVELEIRTHLRADAGNGNESYITFNGGKKGRTELPAGLAANMARATNTFTVDTRASLIIALDHFIANTIAGLASTVEIWVVGYRTP